MALRTLIPALLFLVLAACGDAPPEYTNLVVEGDHEATARNAMEYALDQAMAVELDDGVLGELLATHERVLAKGDDVRGAMSASGDWMRYGKTLTKWKRMQDATRRGVGGAQKQIDRFEKETRRLEEQLAQATGAERERVQQSLAYQQKMRSTFMKQMAAMKELATPENKALVAKWSPRFEALEQKYDD